MCQIGELSILVHNLEIGFLLEFWVIIDFALWIMVSWKNEDCAPSCCESNNGEQKLQFSSSF